MKSRVFSILLAFIYISCNSDKIKSPEIFIAKYSNEQLSQVEFYPSSYIFDTLSVEKDYMGYFYIINRGKNILIIDSVLKSCNCTSINNGKILIQPTDTFKYEFKIRPNEHNNYFVSTLMFHLNTKPFYRQYIIEGFSK